VELLQVHSFGKNDIAPLLCDVVQKETASDCCHLLNDDMSLVVRRISEESQNRVSAAENPPAQAVHLAKCIQSTPRSHFPHVGKSHCPFWLCHPFPVGL